MQKNFVWKNAVNGPTFIKTCKSRKKISKSNLLAIFGLIEQLEFPNTLLLSNQTEIYRLKCEFTL